METRQTNVGLRGSSLISNQTLLRDENGLTDECKRALSHAGPGATYKPLRIPSAKWELRAPVS